MTKILIVSDSHGNSKNIIEAILREKPDVLVHCGDGEHDLERVKMRFPNLDIRNVRGNCDRGSSSPSEICFDADGVRLLVFHGHEHRVRRDGISLELTSAAVENGADIVIHGHTHMAYIEEGPGFFAMNPGTCKGCDNPTYGIVLVNGGSSEIRIADI